MFTKTIFRKYLLSFFLAFVLPLVLLIVVLNGLMNNLENDTRTNGRLALERLVAGTDGKLYNIMRSGNVMLTNERVLYFSTIADPSEYRTNAACFTMLRSLMKDVSSLANANDEIRTAYLYFRNTDSVVGSSYMNARTYFERNLAGEYADYEAWLSFLSNAQDGFVYQRRQDGRDGMSYLRSSLRGDVKIVIELETARVVDSAALLSRSDGGAYAIYGRDGALLYAQTPLFTPALPTGCETPGSGRLLIGEDRTYAFWNQSGDTGCTYVSAIPLSVYSRQIRQYRMLSTASIIILILAEAWLAFILAKRRYQPIEQLSSIVRPEESAGQPEARDDFTYLRDMLGAIKDERHQISQRLRANNQSMEHFVLEQLLRGTYPSVKVAEEQLLALDVVFDSNLFAVLGVRLDSLPPPDQPTDDPAALDESRRLMRFVVHNVLEEQLTDYAPLVLEMSNRVYFLLTLSEGEDAAPAILSCVERAKETLKTHYDMTLSAALSDRVDGMNNISNAFYAVREALNHLKAGQTFDHARGEHEALPDAADVQELAEDAGRRLEHMIAMGDDQAVREEMERFDAAAAGASTWSRRMALCALLNTATKSLKNRLTKEQNRDYQRALRSLIESTPSQEDWKKARALLLMLTDTASDKGTDDKNAENAQRAVVYIERHFMESNLNVTMVADHMRLTPSYASAMFKKCTGKSILDTINSTRVAHARKMLTDTKASIEEIAEQSGYYNTSTFIRVFKKYEGVTPGQYRTLHAPENAEKDYSV